MGWIQEIAKALAAGVDAFRAARDQQRAEIRRQAEARDAELRRRDEERRRAAQEAPR